MSLSTIAVVAIVATSYFQGDPMPLLRVGTAGHAFDHLGPYGEQAEAAVRSGANILYATGLGGFGYSGLPKDLDAQKAHVYTGDPDIYVGVARQQERRIRSAPRVLKSVAVPPRLPLISPPLHHPSLNYPTSTLVDSSPPDPRSRSPLGGFPAAVSLFHLRKLCNYPMKSPDAACISSRFNFRVLRGSIFCSEFQT